MTFAVYLALLRLTFAEPATAAEDVKALLANPTARWTAFGAVIALGAALGLLGEILFSLVTGVDLGPAVSPFLMAALQAAVMLYTAFAMWIFGRQFGGQGRFDEAFSLIIWVQAVLVGGQAVQILVMLLFPLVGVLLTLVLFGLMLWLITLFTAALHGFDNLMLVGAGVLSVFFGTALVFGSILLGLGLAPALLVES